jgi:hypothetical protein
MLATRSGRRNYSGGRLDCFLARNRHPARPGRGREALWSCRRASSSRSAPTAGPWCRMTLALGGGSGGSITAPWGSAAGPAGRVATASAARRAGWPAPGPRNLRAALSPRWKIRWALTRVSCSCEPGATGRSGKCPLLGEVSRDRPENRDQPPVAQCPLLGVLTPRAFGRRPGRAGVSYRGGIGMCHGSAHSGSLF